MKKTELQKHPELYRATLSCKIGKDAIEEKNNFGIPPIEYAMAMMKVEKYDKE